MDKLKMEAELLHGSNKKSLVSGAVETLMPMLVVGWKEEFKDIPRLVVGLSWNDDEEKEKSLRQLGLALGPMKKQVDVVVFSSEMWFTIHDNKKLPKNVTRPRDDPKRKEGILTIACTPDLRDVYSIKEPFSRSSDGKPEFDQEVDSGRDDHGEYYILEKLLGLYGN